MKARLLLWGVFLSLFVLASQAQDVSPTNELETAPPAASDSTPTLSLSEMFEDPDWVWYLATCVDLYLLEAGSPLPAIDAYESPYTYFGSPEVRAVDLGLFWPWLDGNFPMDAANLAVTFDHWRSNACALDETAWLGPALENIGTDPLPGYTGENDGLGWFPEALSPSEPIAAPSAEPAEMETPPTASVDPFAGLSLFELFENPEWLSYLAYGVDLYLVQAGTVLSEDAYESPYAFFGAPAVQALVPGEIAVWLYENFPMDAANLAVTFDSWRSRAAIPAIDPAANEQALDTSADVTTALGSPLDWPNRDPLQEAGGINLYGFVGNNPVTRFDPQGLTDWGDVILGWWDAAWNTFDWVLGHSGSTDYGPDSLQSRQMSQSSIAGQLRDYFLNKNKDKLCKDWKGVSNFKTKFRVFHEVIVDAFNGTAEFVGDARGDVIAKKDLVNCKIKAEFHFMNTTSLRSLLYGVWPDSWNVTLPGFPFANWTQFYTWNETFDCKCCR